MPSKKTTLETLKQNIEEKIASNTSTINAIRESKNTDTKSSAGDKYETGREMMQIELNKYEAQLGLNQKLLSELQKIDSSDTHQVIDFGSLVKTNQGTYFISIGLGAVTVENETVFVLSLASPVGKLLKGKQEGDSVSFQNREIIIERVC